MTRHKHSLRGLLKFHIVRKKHQTWRFVLVKLQSLKFNQKLESTAIVFYENCQTFRSCCFIEHL